eukprot:g29210.t1
MELGNVLEKISGSASLSWCTCGWSWDSYSLIEACVLPRVEYPRDCYAIAHFCIQSQKEYHTKPVTQGGTAPDQGLHRLCLSGRPLTRKDCEASGNIGI